MNRYSNSRIQCYKVCRRMYELRYIHGLVPITKSDALQNGSSYHSKVEQINMAGEFVRDEHIKTNAMATAYKDVMLPQIGRIVNAEVWWDGKDSMGHDICGIVDAVREDGTPVEYKTTSWPIDGRYWASLENDEQILMYLTATGKNRIVYGVMQVPTIRQGKHESDEEFEARCVDWLKDDPSRIQVNELYRDDSQLSRFKVELVATINEIEKCKLFFRNPNSCTRYGRLCDYAPICNSYVPGEKYIGFEVV